MRELAQLVERLERLVDRIAQQRGEVGSTRSTRPARVREPQAVAEREQPLLGAVVEVALEPPALGVAGLDDPRARRAQLVAAGASASACEPLVLDGQPRGGADLALQLGGRERRRVVDDDRELAAVAHDRRARAARAGGQRLDRKPLRVDVPPAAGQRVRDHQVGVAERLGERGAQRPRRRRRRRGRSASPTTADRMRRRPSTLHPSPSASANTAAERAKNTPAKTRVVGILRRRGEQQHAYAAP